MKNPRELAVRLYSGAREDERNKEVALNMQKKINNFIAQLEEYYKPKQEGTMKLLTICSFWPGRLKKGN